MHIMTSKCGALTHHPIEESRYIKEFGKEFFEQPGIEIVAEISERIFMEIEPHRRAMLFCNWLKPFVRKRLI